MNHSPIFSIFFSFFCVLILLQISLAIDTLALNQSIDDRQTLVSPEEKFEFGFFSPGRSKAKYLGIWYKMTPDVVVWVANRNDPLTDSGGVFTLTSNGTLLLLNSTSRVIWSSNVSRVAENPVIKLLDTGNLVLVDNTSTVALWQSFDYPSDTRLPGMPMGVNVETGREQYLTSWRSADDPSPGEFTYRIEYDELSQLVLRRGNGIKFRTGPFNGLRFNALLLFGDQSYDVTYDPGRNRAITVIDPYNSSAITRVMVNQSGFIERYALNKMKNEWEFSYAIPDNPCDYYGHCGPNSICNMNNSPICKCLEGFNPKSPQAWEMQDWSSGCERSMQSESECRNDDTFVKVSGVKMPHLLQFQVKSNMSLSECASECLKNCSCKAYTNPYINSCNISCLMWYGDLIDTRQYLEEMNEQSIYIRKPLSELGTLTGSSSKKGSHALIISISMASAVLISGLICGWIILKRRARRRDLKRKKEDIELPFFDFVAVSAATDNFSKANWLGEGGFGPVYKGKLSTGQEVAVKRLSKSSGQGVEEFKNEARSIAKLQHKNLVRLLGCCIQGDERLLIYDYMQNNSLSHFLFDPNRRASLTWPKRFDIILGVARGLLYLHQDSRLKIIHRDLKASNILLDSNLVPKISDFGSARVFLGDQTFEKTKRVIGTYGYMAPEYAIDGKFSVKSDVFSMGVLILEIVSGKKNRGFSHPDHHHNLLGHAWMLWNENRALDLMDACLEDSFVEYQVNRCIEVGLLCVQKLEEDRPSMSSALSKLGNEVATVPQPKKPGFFIERSSSSDETSSRGSEKSDNDGILNITITELEAR